MGIKINSVGRLPARIAPYLRLRHAKGHGVHSPFVYGLIRNALLYSRGAAGSGGALYEVLRENGVSRLRAVQIQNLHNYCDYARTVVHRAGRSMETGAETGRSVKGGPATEGILEVFTPGCPVATIEARAAGLSNARGAAVVISPRIDRERHKLCLRLADAGDCISIDNRGFMVFIYGSGHAPRHYKL